MISPDGLGSGLWHYVGKGTVSVEDMREFGLGGSPIEKLYAKNTKQGSRYFPLHTTATSQASR
ncbi:hypothetical protein HPB48_011098 [Haemaphysalis longicornis]|uniref:Uncharacterized protein n=1 Tax=Haemaphysalis longicornis TaxID=44386 RepID=A0A9J6GAU4_HAELO|nr:hypothetical protein HPB48_011098 [Haemaphysalis longicornis]